jgi:hypothetical protein
VDAQLKNITISGKYKEDTKVLESGKYKEDTLVSESSKYIRRGYPSIGEG